MTDKTMKVLIVGNGISRLPYYQTIFDFDGEVWGCNQSYLEFGHIYKRIAGHKQWTEDAYRAKIEYGWDFEVWCGLKDNIIDFPHRMFTTHEERFWHNSGTTLVAQALEEGYEVSVIGFDLGGFDIYGYKVVYGSHDHWVKRWRDLEKYYGLENVTFIGYDHKPYILSEALISQYTKHYKRANRPHIKTDEYKKLFEQFKIERKKDREYRGEQYIDFAIKRGVING